MTDHQEFADRARQKLGDRIAQEPAPPPTVTQVQIGEALINPQWQGHLIVLSDNGGDLVMVTIKHPRIGDVQCIWSRAMAANIRAWLEAALQAPVLNPQGQQQSQLVGEPQGTA
jgi:hypothetical protein